jgi:hypothetical protein
MRALLRVALLLALLPVGARAQANHLLVITGASGGPEYTQRFHQWATKLVDAAARTNVADIAYLSDQPELGGKITGKSSRENVEAAFKSLAANTKPGMLYWLCSSVTAARTVALPVSICRALI